MRAGDRRGEEHAAGALLLHRHEGGSGGVESAAQIDRHDAVPVVGAGVFDQLPGIDAGILNDDIEPAKTFERKGDGSFGVRHLCDVGTDEGGAQLVRGCLCCVGLRIGEYEPRTLFGKALGNTSADAAGCAHDKRDLAFEPSCHANL